MALLISVIQPLPADAAASRTGATRYVRVYRLRSGKLTIVLTPRGRRTFRRDLRRDRVLYASCVHLRDTPQGASIDNVTFPAAMSLGTGGTKTYRPIVDPRADFCDVNLALIARAAGREKISLIDRPPLDAVPLTVRGAEYLEEDQIAVNSWTILFVARIDAQTIEPGDRFPPAELLVGSLRKVGGYGKVVVLGAPTSSPPAGTTGIYSDTDAHLEIVTVSASGTRLFIDQNAGVYSTNMQDHIDRFLRAKLPDPFE